MNIIEFWEKKETQIAIDIIRVLLLIIAVIVAYILISNINEVKILNSDVCRICMAKTGCSCSCIGL